MKYDVLVIDPPWSYNNKRTGGSLVSGAGQKYETMTPVDIQNLWDDLQLDKIINKDALLFLWTTNNMLPYAICCPDLWGFEYKTMITWVKKNYGLGYWFRGKTEHCLFGIKGKVPALKMNLPNIIESKQVLKHSEKPPEFYQLVNDVATKYQKIIDKEIQILELFGRKKSSSAIRWIVLGNEISGNDIREDLKALVA